MERVRKRRPFPLISISEPDNRPSRVRALREAESDSLLTSARSAWPTLTLLWPLRARPQCRHWASRRWECPLAPPAGSAFRRESHPETIVETPCSLRALLRQRRTRPDRTYSPFHRRRAPRHVPELGKYPCIAGLPCPPGHARVSRLDAEPVSQVRGLDSVAEKTAAD